MRAIFRHVYHLALRECLGSILGRGLVPSVRATGSGWQHIVYDRPSVFVLTRRTPGVVDEALAMISNKHLPKGETHEHWTEDRWTRFQRSYVLLTVDLTRCEGARLAADTRVGKWVHSAILEGKVPPKAIVAIENVRFSWRTPDALQTQRQSNST